jgi:hypothetical protein
VGRAADLNTEQLLAVVRDGGPDPVEILEVLRNPYCTIEIAELVASRREWASSHLVRERLAGFPGLSVGVALNLLATLPWLSLLHVGQNPRTPPVIRRHAEKKLVERVHTLALGEKVALARLAHRPLFRALIQSGDEPVSVALLDNPRLVENDILVMLNSDRLADSVVLLVSRHRRWGSYYGVRRALAAHRRTPLPIALGLLVQLKRVDLAGLAGDPRVEPRIREAAGDLLELERVGRRRVIQSRGDVAPRGLSDGTHRVW